MRYALAIGRAPALGEPSGRVVFERIGAAKNFLAEHKDVADKIEAAIRQNSGILGQNLIVGDSEKDDDE